MNHWSHPTPSPHSVRGSGAAQWEERATAGGCTTARPHRHRKMCNIKAGLLPPLKPRGVTCLFRSSKTVCNKLESLCWVKPRREWGNKSSQCASKRLYSTWTGIYFSREKTVALIMSEFSLKNRCEIRLIKKWEMCA